MPHLDSCHQSLHFGEPPIENVVLVLPRVHNERLAARGRNTPFPRAAVTTAKSTLHCRVAVCPNLVTLISRPNVTK